jgi:hypothetical protein
MNSAAVRVVDLRRADPVGIPVIEIQILDEHHAAFDPGIGRAVACEGRRGQNRRCERHGYG